MKDVVSATLVVGALALGTGAASAADMPLKAPEIVPVFTWSGWYVGGNIGWISGNADVDPVCPTLNPNCPVLFPGFAFITNTPGVPPITTFVPGSLSGLPGVSGSDKSFMGGGQIGYNYQSGIVVFGVEADLDWTHINISLNQNAIALAGGPPGFFGTVTANSAFSNDWVGSARGRLGLGFDRFMIYGTGGLAVAQTTVNTAWVYTPPANSIPAFNLPGPTGANWTQVLMGWTAGVGGEWYVAQHVSVGAEYRHSDFGHQNVSLGFDVLGAPISTNIHYTTDEVTLRANWHFDWR